MPTTVIAIFDIGKTNKKFFLFNQQYQIVVEETQQFDEVVDDDGDVCDDVQKISSWVIHTLQAALQNRAYNIVAVNISSYGASFVHLNAQKQVVMPLYNYLKEFPQSLQQQFYQIYQGQQKISLQTASPVLGNLNSGMQLYWLKNAKPQLYKQIAFALHLPQYISFLISGQCYTDITSIGCHTQLWNFEEKNYHHWVLTEGIDKKFPELYPCNATLNVLFRQHPIKVGIGLHDSSAALIPYLTAFVESFVLISTGTWCISLNPFNNQPLTIEELQQDCLCYLTYKANPVKASRLFAGYEHEVQTKKIAKHFNVQPSFYKSVTFNVDLVKNMQPSNSSVLLGVHPSAFETRDINSFQTYQQAYHQLMFDIMQQQKISTSLAIGNNKVSRIFVDGGFAKNTVYMNLLAISFPSIEVYAASVSQATALGAALAIHSCWNPNPITNDMIELKYYAAINSK